MDSDLIRRVLNYHGQQMTKIWDIEKGNKSLQKLDVKGLDYHEYQQRAKELAIQDRSKRVKIHHFIVEKAEVLFRPPRSQDEVIITLEEQDAIVPLPPLESFLNVSKEEKRVQLTKALKVGDVVICQVLWRTVHGGSSMALKIISLDGGKKRDLSSFQFKGYINPSHMAPAEGNKDGIFLVNDYVRAEIVELTETEKLHLGLQGTTASPEVLKHYPLGLIKPDDMQNLARLTDYRNTKGRTFEDFFEESLQSENPEVVPILARLLGLDDCDEASPRRSYTHMIGLGGIARSDLAPALRKSQAAKWAFKSVSDGIKYFKEGQEIEAFQCLNKALSIDPSNVEGLVARGALYANRGNFEKAIDDFMSALKENIAHPNALKYLAETLCAQGKQCEDDNNIDDALTSYQRCLAIVPGHTEAREAIMTIIPLKRKQLDGFELVPLPSDDPYESVKLKLIRINNEASSSARPMDSDQSDGEDEHKPVEQPRQRSREESLSPFSRKMATIDSSFDNPEGKSLRPPPPEIAGSKNLEDEYAEFLKGFINEPPPPKISESLPKEEKRDIKDFGVAPPPPILSFKLDTPAPPPPVLSGPPSVRMEPPKISVVSQERMKTGPTDVKLEPFEQKPIIDASPTHSKPPPAITPSITPPTLPITVTPPVNLPPGEPHPPFAQHPPVGFEVPPFGHQPSHLYPESAGPPPFDPRAPPGFYPPQFGYKEHGPVPGYPYGMHTARPPHAHHHRESPSGSSYDDQVRAFLERITPSKPRISDEYHRSDKSKRKSVERRLKEKKKEKKEKKKQKKKRVRSDSDSSDTSSSDSEVEKKKKRKHKDKSGKGKTTGHPDATAEVVPDLDDLPDFDEIQKQLSEYYKKVDRKEENAEKELDKEKEKTGKDKKKKKKKKRARSSSTSSGDSMPSGNERRSRSPKKDESEEKTPAKKHSQGTTQKEIKAQQSTIQTQPQKEEKKPKEDIFDESDDDDLMAALAQRDRKLPGGKIAINLKFKKAEEEKKQSAVDAATNRSVLLGSRKPTESQVSRERKSRSRSRSRTDAPLSKISLPPSVVRVESNRRSPSREKRRSRDRPRSPSIVSLRSSSRNRRPGDSRERRRSPSRERRRSPERLRSEDRRRSASRGRRSSSRDRSRRDRHSPDQRRGSPDERHKPQSTPGRSSVEPVVVKYDPRFDMFMRVAPPAPSIGSEKPQERRSRSRSRIRYRSRSRDRRSRSRDRRSRSRGRRRSFSMSRSPSPRGYRGGYRGRNPRPFRGGYRGRGFRGQTWNRGGHSSSPDRSSRSERQRPEEKRNEVREYPEEPRAQPASIPKGEPPKHKETGVDIFAPESAFLKEEDEYEKIEEMLRKKRAEKKGAAKEKNKEFFRP